MMRKHVLLIAALLLAACGQPASTSAPPPAPAENADTSTAADQQADYPAPDASILAAPNSGFTAVEPSELGVQGAPTVREALGPLLSSDVNEGAQMQLS